MARLVRVEPTGPLKIEPASLPQDKPLFICQCGLSQKMPFCDGSHKISRNEQPGLLYIYSKDAQHVLETRPDQTPA
jgi:CDGSH-type Zn-finger protein